MVLTVVCAVVLSVVSTIEAPAGVRLGIAVYLMLMAGYFCLRVPHLCRRASALGSRWSDTRLKREEFEAMVEQAKADREKK